MSALFGTNGIGGVAGQYPLDRPTIELIGYSLAVELTSRFNRVPLIIIGRDTRESGEWIEAALTRGAAAAQAGARSAGVITTPGVAYLTRELDADAGVVISASHNSYEDNGIKIFSASGQKLDDAAEEAIEAILKPGDSKLPAPVGVKIATDTSLKEKYLAFLGGEIGAGLELNGLKIAVDCANGAAYELAPRLLSALGAELIVINADPNGRNINLDCGS